MMTTRLLPALLLIPLAASAEPRREGKWEVTVTMEMPGMGRMPPMTHTQCLTKKDMVPHNPRQQGDCKVVEQKMSGNTMRWKVLCTGERTAEATGEITFAADTFTGRQTIKMNDPRRGPMEMKQEMSGRRVGDCDAP